MERYWNGWAFSRWHGYQAEPIFFACRSADDERLKVDRRPVSTVFFCFLDELVWTSGTPPFLQSLGEKRDSADGRGLSMECPQAVPGASARSHEYCFFLYFFGTCPDKRHIAILAESEREVSSGHACPDMHGKMGT